MRDKIIQRDLAEFYVLSALSPIIEQRVSPIHNKLMGYRNGLVVDIVQFYLEHLQHACAQEANYENCRTWPSRRSQELNRKQLESIGVKTNSDINENFLYARASEDAPSNFLLSAKRIIIVFRYMNWSASYGGEAWARIADLYKSLLECRQSFTALDLTDYDPNRGYDTYTHSTIREIRDHLNGFSQNKIQKTMHVIDMLHQVEHNTGSIFTKFPGGMTTWLDNMLNEKAIACSIQVLRDSVGVEIKNVMQELGIEDSPNAIAEQQLGQVIVERRRAKDNKKFEEQYKQQLQDLNHDLDEDYITEDVYEEKVKVCEEERHNTLDEPDLSTYIAALSEHYDSPREQRGILREIVCVSEHKPEFIDSKNDLLQYVKSSIHTDYEMFKILQGNTKWHAALAKYIIPQYSNIPFKWKRIAADFLYENFKDLFAGVPHDGHLNLSTVRTLHDCLYSDGYDMTDAGVQVDEFACNCSACRPDALIARPDHKLDSDAKAFAVANFGRLIVGNKEWITNNVNVGSKSLYVDEDLPIGSVIGYNKFGKICFTPSEHWRECGYNAASYEVVISNIELYDITKPAKLKRPRNAKAFARFYAGNKIKFKKDVATGWNKNLPAGIVIGYSASMENSIYYIPSEEFVAAGYRGMKNNTDIIYTDNKYNNDNIPPCYHASFDEIAAYIEPETKAVDIYDVAPKPMPPKGGGSAKEFATKYAGKTIKATYKYAFALNAAHDWDSDVSIGTIIGYVDASKSGKDTHKICFAPSDKFKNAGWGGTINFGGFVSTTVELKDSPTYYTVNWNNIELMNSEEYEKQVEITDVASGLTYNQNYAVSNAGKEINGISSAAWKALGIDLKRPVGSIAGYKGSLIYYTPSQQMKDAGFCGYDVGDITYTDESAKGKKCYSLLGTSAIKIHTMEQNEPWHDTPFNTIYKFATKYAGKEIKGVGKTWEKFAKGGIKWDMTWPIGTVIGYHKYPLSICYTPSKQLKDFGYDGVEYPKEVYGSLSYTTNEYKNIPFYDAFDLNGIAPVEVIEDPVYDNPYKPQKPAGLTNKSFATMFAGKKVKKLTWDESKVVGTIIGYKKGSNSVVWQATDEYNESHPAVPLHEQTKITNDDYDQDKGVHWCIVSSLEVCDDLTPEQTAAAFAIKNAGLDIISKDNKYLGYIVGYIGDNICYVPNDGLTDNDALDFVPVVSGQPLVKTAKPDDVSITYDNVTYDDTIAHNDYEIPLGGFHQAKCEKVNGYEPDDYISINFPTRKKLDAAIKE